MNHAEADRLFRRFQESHDAAAIAAVYDGLAPELLLIAAHLGHRAGDAEDLVQNTFLAALESADRFDSARRLMPWLIGILVNQARREHRRRLRTPDPTALEQLPQIDPALAAEDTEFREELARQLEALPANYRLSLTLRWVHGLSPTEIAHAIGEPPATVRTRLRRGQEFLRQALPVGFAAAAFLVSGSTALAAGRAVVLRRAEEIAAAAVAPAAGLSLLSSSTSSVLPVALAVACVTAVAAWWSGVPSSPATTAETAAITTTQGPPDPVRPNTEERTVAELPAVNPVTPTSPPPGSLRLEVRFADGTIAPNVGIAVRGTVTTEPLLTERWIVTGPDGAAELNDIAAGTYDLIGDRAGRWSATLTEVAGANRTIVLNEGLTIGGSVVGVDAKPLAEAGIWISGGEQPDEGRIITRSDADGRFVIRDVAPGRSFGVFADGFVPRPLERLSGDPGHVESRRIDMSELVSSHALSGVVTDAAGEPVVDARVQVGRRLAFIDFDKNARGPLERSPPVFIRTDDAGAFVVAGLVPFEDTVDVWARAPGHATGRALVSFVESKTASVTIALPQSRRLVGICRTADGEPRGHARVVVRTPNLGPVYEAPRWAQATGWSDADGGFSLEGISHDAVVATARAEDGAEAALSIAAGDLDITWNATLLERRPLFGVVRTDDGAPLAGVMVRALVSRGHVEPKPAITDEKGAFRLEETLDDSYDIWVADPASAWNGSLVTKAAIRPGPSPISLVVDRHRISTANVIGRVVDRHGNPVRAHVRLTNLHVGIAFTTTEDGAGRFRLGPIPPLESAYDLLALDESGGFVARFPIVLQPHQTLDLDELVVEPAGQARFRFVDVAGRTLAKAPDGTSIRVSTASGAFVRALESGAPGPLSLPPDDYRLHLDGDGAPLAATAFRVDAERTTDVEVTIGPAFPRRFEFRHPDDGWDLRLDLEWCDADGVVLARDRMQCSHDDPITLSRSFSEGEVRLRARSQTGARAEVRFRIPAPEDAPPILIELE